MTEVTLVKDEIGDSREYPSRPVCGVGAVVRKDDAVLLIRRGKPPRMGEWSIPGGAVEVGETLQQAVQREVREECGIEISVGEVAEALDIILRDEVGRVQYHYVIIDFAATWRQGDLCATSDVTDARWVARRDLDQYPMNAKTREVILKGLHQT